jgi:hypothetical protein
LYFLARLTVKVIDLADGATAMLAISEDAMYKMEQQQC